MGGRGSAPDPAGGVYSTPPDPVARLRASKWEGRERSGRWGKRGKEREGVMKWYPTFCDKVTPLGDVITTAVFKLC